MIDIDIKNKPLPRMRTIRETAALFGIAEHFVRTLVKQNKIVYVKAGNKALINIDCLSDYLERGEQA